jgi:YD repeat-containing protein
MNASTTGTRSITYDARGNTVSETRPNAVGVTAAYDGFGRLTSYARTGEASHAHVYNGMDQRVTMTRTASGGSAHAALSMTALAVSLANMGPVQPM